MIAPKDKTLSLIIGQLQHYGYNALAASVSGACGIPLSTVEPSSALAECIGAALLNNISASGSMLSAASGSASNNYSAGTLPDEESSLEVPVLSTSFLDLERTGSGGGGGSSESVPVPQFVTRFISTHKGPVTAAAFSVSGKMVATGSTDATVKVMDVNRLINTKSSSAADSEDNKPTTKTYYDHSKASCL